MSLKLYLSRWINFNANAVEIKPDLASEKLGKFMHASIDRRYGLWGFVNGKGKWAGLGEYSYLGGCYI